VSHFPGRIRSVVTPLGFVLFAPKFRANREMQAGQFEPDELACLQSLLQTSDRLVDVGANVGWYTCVARSMGRPAIAIEPQAQNLSPLFRTLIANNWSDTEVVPMAIGASPGIRVLYGASGPSASLLRGWAGYRTSEQALVPLTTLDALLSGRFEGERLLIKIDVEGAEFDVIQGATATLRRVPRPNWIVEVCLHQFHPHGNSRFLETFDRFWEAGYGAYLVQGRPQLVTRQDILRWVKAGRTDSPVFNYVFSPVESRPHVDRT
jgi:FkbM family methyltransferase